MAMSDFERMVWFLGPAYDRFDAAADVLDDRDVFGYDDWQESELVEVLLTFYDRRGR